MYLLCLTTSVLKMVPHVPYNGTRDQSRPCHGTFWNQDWVLRQCWMRQVTHETPLLHGLISVLFYKHEAIVIALRRIALQKIHELLPSRD